MSTLQNSNAISNEGYIIENSLRFDKNIGTNLTRTFSIPTNQNIWSLSLKLKQGHKSSFYSQCIFSAYLDSSNYAEILLTDYDDQIQIRIYVAGVAQCNLFSTRSFGDYSAHYNFLFTFDLTNANTSNRIRAYIDNTEISFTGTYYTSSSVTQFNQNGALHSIGGYTATNYFDGYISEIYFIDGQVLIPGSFGEVNSNTGQWTAKKYTGIYGNNGFYLNFKNGTSTTTLGKDSTANLNNWTLTNFTRTPGFNDCWSKDIPSSNEGSGAQPSSNYAVLNNIHKTYNVYSTISAGGLRHLGSNADSRAYSSIQLPTSGMFYAEFTNNFLQDVNNKFGFGIASKNANISGVYNITGNYGFYIADTPYIINNGVSTSITSHVSSANQTYKLAVDMATGKIWIGQNSIWWDSVGGSTGNPTLKTNPTMTINPGNLVFIYTYINTVDYDTITVNFGQQEFVYSIPTGFKTLCTANLPTPVIKQGKKHFDAITYTGNGTSQEISTSSQFSPDLVWIKSRNEGGQVPLLFDSIRGGNKSISSSLPDIEKTWSGQSFTNTGFIVDRTYSTETNTSNIPYILWGWKGSDNAPVTNTRGTIPTIVNVNVEAGFSIIKYTGNNTAGATIGHGLNTYPQMIFFKSLTNSTNWTVYSLPLLGPTIKIPLNGLPSSLVSTYSTAFNNTYANLNLITLGGGATSNEVNTGDMVAYCFGEVPGYSSFGYYTGVGSNINLDGPFINCGFKPQFIMIKSSNGGTNWMMFDTTRDTYNRSSKSLTANLYTANIEQDAAGAFTSKNNLDILSNGFKIKWGDTNLNTAGYYYMYMAFAENPFQYSNAK